MVHVNMAEKLPSNADIADLLDRLAGLLEQAKENPFRIQSYRKASASVRKQKESVARLAAKSGVARLTDIPGIGERLAGLIEEYVRTGNVELLDTLGKNSSGDKSSSPGASPKGKPVAVKKKKEVRGNVELPVEVILDVDAEYLKKVKAGSLKMIAPRRFNPDGKAWLPLLRTERKGWKFTVMFSNTERAHELGKTDDWVVVYYERGEGENQCTVVTDQRGPMKGKRVIRGRETECREFYGR
jgi:putative hydrolase